ncbi:MAG: hypothetical protein OZ921_08860 [Sorangiineae bacterium]|nr:hypothetical protein [Polyangiaceae bacterium]MEB2322611.1 hypothetical protein [Sorangiineae bacterium]
MAKEAPGRVARKRGATKTPKRRAPARRPPSLSDDPGELLDENELGLTTTQVLPWCGTVHTLARTKLTRYWIEALRWVGLDQGIPGVAIVLSGVERSRFPDIGRCQAGFEGDEHFDLITLDDWKMEQYDELYRDLWEELPRSFPLSAQRDTLIGYLAHVALHELGHALHNRQNRAKGVHPFKGELFDSLSKVLGRARAQELASQDHERQAECFSWSTLERILAPVSLYRTRVLFERSFTAYASP